MPDTIPEFCIIHNMNYDGEVMHGTFDGTFYVLDDGDCYLPETIMRYSPEFFDIDPRN